VKVLVDQARCNGHARCNAAAPDIYELDDLGYCAISELTVPAGREEAALKGAEDCPERAISVERLPVIRSGLCRTGMPGS
jgi:ferredoxin